MLTGSLLTAPAPFLVCVSWGQGFGVWGCASGGTARKERRESHYPLFLAQNFGAQGALLKHGILMSESREEREAEEEKERDAERERGGEGKQGTKTDRDGEREREGQRQSQREEGERAELGRRGGGEREMKGV